MVTAMASPTSEAGNSRLESAFAEEERKSLRLITIVRTAAMLSVCAYMLIQGADSARLYWASLPFLFAALGLLQFAVARSALHASWHVYLFATIDAVFLTFAFLLPNPFIADHWGSAMAFRYPNFPYFFVLLGVTALTYSPRVVIWAGMSGALAWSAGIAAIVAQSGVVTELDGDTDGLPRLANQAAFLSPEFVDLGGRTQEIFVLLLVTAILATSVARSRRLVRRQMSTERARANLARYFSPTMVDELAGLDEPLGTVRQQNVAVLFADIVGFTALSEKAGAEQVIDLLRQFHGRMARDVFAHRGTVDKYIGDAIMATFGTPRSGQHDATDAVRCARAMLSSIEAWNRERANRGEAPIRIGIGVHYGPAVLGDIGDQQRVEYAVVGDTVNVASRLEAMTRSVGAPLIVSDTAIRAAQKETSEAAAILAGLVEGAARDVRGREAPVAFWALPSAG